MEKIYGTTHRQDGLQHIGRDRWLLYYGYYETGSGAYEYRHTFDHRPTLEEVKAVINSQISADADERKRTGFQWQGVPLRYDDEAAANITGISVKIPRLGDAMFPLKFKLGDYPDGSPAFHVFKDTEEFESFTDALLMFSNECYEQSWSEKNDIDWTKFNEAL